MNYAEILKDLLHEIKPDPFIAHQAITTKVELMIRNHLAYKFNLRKIGKYLKKELRATGGTADLAFIKSSKDLKSPECLVELKQFYTEDAVRSTDYFETVIKDLNKYPSVNVPKLGLLILIHMNCSLEDYESHGHLFTYFKYFLPTRKKLSQDKIKNTAIVEARKYYQDRLKGEGTIELGEYDKIKAELIYFIVD